MSTPDPDEQFSSAWGPYPASWLTDYVPSPYYFHPDGSVWKSEEWGKPPVESTVEDAQAWRVTRKLVG